MKRQIRNNGSEVVELKNTAFKKLYILLDVIADTDAINLTSKSVDLTKIRVGLTLTQHGAQVSSSFNGVGPAALSVLKNRDAVGFGNLNFGATGTTCQGHNIQTSGGAGSGIFERSLVVLPIYYDSIMLRSNDLLEVAIDNLSGLFDNGCDLNSKVYLVTEEGADTEQLDLCVPVFYPITTDKQSPSYNEQAVKEIFILSSYNQTETIDFPYNAIDVRSTFYNERYDVGTLYAKGIIDTVQVSDGMNVLIFASQNSTLNDVEVNLDIDTSKLHTGCEFLYVMRSKFSSGLAKYALSHNQKVLGRKLAARGVMKPNTATLAKKW